MHDLQLLWAQERMIHAVKRQSQFLNLGREVHFDPPQRPAASSSMIGAAVLGIKG
jgi:hypothetical protein